MHGIRHDERAVRDGEDDDDAPERESACEVHDDLDPAYLRDLSKVPTVTSSLRRLARRLIEGHVVESLYPKFQARDWCEVAGNLILSERTIDIERSRIDATWRIFNGDEWDTRFSSIRMYTYREMAELFRQAGFTDVQGFTGHTRSRSRSAGAGS